LIVLFVGWLLALTEAQQLGGHKVPSSSKHFDEVGWAKLKFRNGITSGSTYGINVDLYLNNVPFLREVSYNTSSSSYIDLPAQTGDFVATEAGTTNVLSEAKLELLNNQSYTLALSGSLDDLKSYPAKFFLFQDNNTFPEYPVYEPSVRVIHLSPGLPNLEIANGVYTTIFSTFVDNVGYGQASDYGTARTDSLLKADLAISNLTVISPVSLYSNHNCGVLTLWIIGQYNANTGLKSEVVCDRSNYDLPQRTEMEKKPRRFSKRGFLTSFLAKRASQQRLKSSVHRIKSH